MCLRRTDLRASGGTCAPSNVTLPCVSNAARQQCAHELLTGAATDGPNTFLQLPRPFHRRVLRWHLSRTIVG